MVNGFIQKQPAVNRILRNAKSKVLQIWSVTKQTVTTLKRVDLTEGNITASVPRGTTASETTRSILSDGA